MTGNLRGASNQKQADAEKLLTILQAFAKGADVDASELPTEVKRLLADAQKHKVKSVVMHFLLQQSISDDTKESLRCQLRQLSLQKLRQLHYFLRLSKKLEDAGLDFIWLKGPVLSQQLYGVPLYRDFGDLDCWVRESDFPTAIDVIQLQGFENVPNDHKNHHHITFFHPVYKVVIELHNALGPWYFRDFRTSELFWNLCESHVVENQNVPVLSNESQLIYLCHHGNRHRWYCLQWVLDVAVFVNTIPIKWDELIQLARDIKQLQSLLLGLAVAHHLFQVTLPSQILTLIEAQPRVKSLTKSIAKQYDSEDVLRDKRTHLRIHFFILENLRDRITFWVSFILTNLFSTNIKDRPVQLPRYLAWLYFPMRLVRLIYVYGIYVAIQNWAREGQK